MKNRTAKRKVTEAAVGVVIGGAIAGPVGAVAGGLAAGHVESGLEKIARLKPREDSNRMEADDPLAHVWPKRILVPLDFSPPSQQALMFASQWATHFGADVFLLHVIEPAPVAGNFGTLPPATDRREDTDQAKAAMEELGNAEFDARIPVTAMVRNGPAFDQIAAVAHEVQADLIIMATHGRTGLKRVLLGSTTERVARHAPCPVLILRRRPRPEK